MSTSMKKLEVYADPDSCMEVARALDSWKHTGTGRRLACAARGSCVRLPPKPRYTLLRR